MADKRHISGVYGLASELAEQNVANMREVIAKSLEVLKAPQPDTFLGRKTMEPFPEENIEPFFPKESESKAASAGGFPDGKSGRTGTTAIVPKSLPSAQWEPF